MAIKIRKDVLNKFIFIYIIFMGYMIRSKIIESLFKSESAILQINYIACIGILLFFIKKTRKKIFPYMVIGVVIGAYLLNFTVFSTITQKDIVFLFSVIIPMCLIFIECTKEEFLKGIREFHKYFTTLIIIIFFMGLVWFCFNNFYNFKIAPIFLNNRMIELIRIENLQNVNRYYSILGHPLFTNQVSLTYLFISYMIFVIDKNRKKYNINTAIGTIIILLSASKTGVILLAVYYIFFFFNIKNLSSIIIGFISLLLMYSAGLFNSIINRFMFEDLTTGRIEILEKLKSLVIYNPKLLGYGNGFSYNLIKLYETKATSFEFPLIIWIYDIGILLMIIIYFIILLYPMLKLIKYKNIKCLIMFFIMFININTYNGITDIGDSFMFYCIFLFSLLNFAKWKF